MNAEEVTACPQELRTRAAKAKESEERRQKALAENPLKRGGKFLKYTEELPTNVPTYAEPENLDEEKDVESVYPTVENVTPTQLSPELEQ